MSEVRDPESGAEGQPAAYSKDYWDIVMSQLRRRPSVRVSLIILAILYGLAIYAPLLASDRPLHIEATDAASYRRAQRLLVPISTTFRGLVTRGEAAFEVGAAGRDFATTLGAERDAIAQRVKAMSAQLSDENAELLAELEAQTERALTLSLAGNTEAAGAAAEQVVDLARRARAELEPAAEGAAAEPGRTVELVAKARRPVLEAISALEIYFMVLWAFVLCWPLWNWVVNRGLLRGDKERIRSARRIKVWSVLLLPVVAALLWPASESPYQTSAWKAGLTSGEVKAVRVVFPPVPFGLAEINDAEAFRPPTWTERSQIDESGRYLHGARSATVDPLTGYEVPARPVTVRSGEPALNDGRRHPLGTDSLGRDILARMLWGGRISLSVGLVSTVFLVLIGVVLGALAGYWGGWVDLVISRMIEIFQCFPPFFLILIVVAFIGPGLLNIMLVLGLTRWPGVARLVRGEFLRLREQDFVVASEALGVRPGRTIFRHVLPNAMGPVLVAATFSVASGILTESALSFLGFGIELPVPSWGSLLIESRSAEHWWIQVFPGLVIFITVLLYNLLGEGVRDALDPRLKS